MENEVKKDCYLGINGKKYGPVSEQDIKNLYAQKKINGDTKFARVGGKEWITISKSGIVTPKAADDVLPTLPEEGKPEETIGTVKKSKLGLIAAGLGVATVISIAALIGLVATMSNNAAVPANSSIAQNNNTEKLADNPTKEETANAPIISDESLPANDSELAYLTFRVPQFGVEFDYPSNFVCLHQGEADSGGLVNVQIGGPEEGAPFISFIFESSQSMEELAELADLAGMDSAGFRAGFKSLDVDEAIASRKSLLEEEEDGIFEVRGSSKSTNSYWYSYIFNDLGGKYSDLVGESLSHLAFVYKNYGDFSDANGIFTIHVTFNIQSDYADNYDDFFRIFQTITGSIRRIDHLWKDAEDLIPSQYKEGSLEYHPAYNIEDDDGGVLFYGFSFYAKDIYGEILVNPVTGEIEVDSREMPAADEPVEPGESISNNIIAENTTPPKTAADGIIGEWEMQEEGYNYHLKFGADGSYNKNMSIIFGAGGAIDMGTYEIISEDTIRLTLKKVNEYVYEETYRLDGDALYFGDNATPYHRYVEPIDPNVLLDEKYEGTPLSPSYGNNTDIYRIIFNAARANILDGDEYTRTRDPNYITTYAKSRYEAAKVILEQQGYEDTPLYQFALRKWLSCP